MGYVVAVRWMAKSGQGDRIAEIQEEFAPLARLEAGCRKYFVNRSPDDADQFFLYEEYDDEAAFDTHRRTSHFERMIRGEALDLIEVSEKAVYESLT